jgi:hypothetical protein
MWYRHQDRAGVAFITNAICKDHQLYLADGSLGFLLGDGRLNYGRENIVETYSTAHVWRGIYQGPDLQHIQNPGYNRDRGPVLVPASECTWSSELFGSEFFQTLYRPPTPQYRSTRYALAVHCRLLIAVADFLLSHGIMKIGRTQPACAFC